MLKFFDAKKDDMAQETITEQRRLDRKTLRPPVQVYDAMSGERLGQIGNITSQGLMIISPDPIEEDLLFQLNFTLPAEGKSAHAFTVGAHCLWCSEAESTGTHWAGFEIMDIADADAALLEDAVEQL